jgi:GMP synthase-like glutamine amidotransferase
MYLVILNCTTTPEPDVPPFRYIPAADLLSQQRRAAAIATLLAQDTEGLIISGGPQYVSALEEFPELHVELELIRIAAERNKFVLGICLGFQLLNHAFGNRVERLDTPRIGCGYFDTTTTNTAGDDRLRHLDMSAFGSAFSFHYDGVRTNNSPDLVAVAWSRCGLLYAVRHRTKSLYGFQIHPESTVEEIADCLSRYGATTNPETPIAAAADLETIRSIFFRVFLGKPF